MRHLYLLCIFLGSLLLSILSFDTVKAQGCLGADGSGIFTGGVNSVQNGALCVNIDNTNTLATHGAILEVTVGNVFAGDLVEARVNWNDGSGFTAWFTLPNIGGTTHRANSPKHFFPSANTNCEYIPTTEYRINGTTCNTNWGTPPVFPRWNIEGPANSASSVFSVVSVASAGVAAGQTVVEVCAGVQTIVTFEDLSNLNCNTFPGDVTLSSNRNSSRRWRQFVYGGAGALNGITGGVTVGATPVAAGTGLDGTVITYTMTSGAPAGTGGGSDQPQNSGTHGNPPTAITSDAITIPATALVGEEFVITTRYWNACNRYDQVATAGSPVEYNATRIRVVAQPTAPTAVAAAAVCNGTTRAGMSTFGITGAPAGATVRWYANVSGATPKVPGTVGALITTTTASGAGASSISFATAFPGAGATVMPAENYIVWATYIGASGSILCESFPRAVTRSVREALSLTGQTITPTINGNLCPGTSGHTFALSMPAAPNTRPVGGDTEYVWTVPANWTITAGQGTNLITVSLNASAASGSQSPSVVWRYTTAPQCTSGSISQAVTVLALPNISASTGNRDICEDGSTTFGVTASGAGITYQWEIDADGAGPGTFVNVPTAGGDPYSGETSATLSVNLGGLGLGTSLNGALYRCVVSGTCSPSVTSTSRSLTVRAKPVITTEPTDKSICVEGSTTFDVVATGQAVLTYQWQVDTGSGFTNVVNGGPYSGATTATLTVNTAGFGSTFDGYLYRVIVGTTGAQCTGNTDTSITVTLTVDGPTTDITTGVTASTCADADLNLLATESFSNGVFASRVWTGTYDETGAPPLIVLTPVQLDALLTDGGVGSRRTALNPIFNSDGLGPNKTGVYVLRLTTTDNNGCTDFDEITVNVTEVDANILFGFSAGTITDNSLNASICASTNLFLNGNASGGSGTYTTHTWAKISGPGGAIGTLLSDPTIANPVFNTTISGTYELGYFVQDNAGCNFNTAPTKNITIVVSPLPVSTNQTPAAICSTVSGGTTAVVDLTAQQTAINNTGTVTFAWFSDAGLTTPIAPPASATVTNGVAVYARVRENAAPNCFSVATVTYTVDPRPALPTSNGDIVVCSDAIGAATVSVANPGAGIEIDWYDAAVAGNLLLSNNPVLNPAAINEPTAGNTVTYYAQARSTSATACISSGRTAVSLTSDARPTNPSVGGNFSTCSDASALTGNVADNGGTGTWTIGSAIYNATFSSAENNIGLTGTTPGTPATLVRPEWTLTVDPLLYSGGDVNDYFKVTGGAFSGQDLNNGTMTWESKAIDITAFSTVKVSVRLAEFGTQVAGDFIRATYTIDGGAPQLIGEILGQGTDGVFQTFTATTAPAGTSLKIYVTARNNGNTDHHDFDDVQVFATTTTAVPIIADVNNPVSAVTNLQDGANVFTWTITSALGACALPPAVLTITKNPQPITQDINFSLCETNEGTLDHLNYDLTVHDLAVANGSLVNRSVTWFTNAALTVAVPDATDVTVSDTDIFYARVENTATGCTNVTPILNPGSVTFTVNPLPVALDQDATNSETVYCEEFPVGSGLTNNVNLTILNDNIIGGVVPNRTVAWFESDGVTPVATPGDIDGVVDGRIFIARVTNTVTSCVNTAQVEITVNPLPLDNAIITPSGTTPATFTVCVSTTILLFQVSPTLNPGSTYDWNIPTGAGQFVLFGGGGVNDFFVLLQFPNAVPGGLPITVTETSADGCVGNVNTLTVIVDSAPAAPVIVGDNNVCATENNVSYSIAAPGISTYTWTVPGTLGSIVSGQGTDDIIVNISNTSGNITVIETNATGCVSPPAAPFNVTVNPRPALNPPFSEIICSGDIVNSAVTLTGSIVGTQFAWSVLAKIGSVGGATVGDVGTGQIGQTLTNVSSSIGQIVYDVTPRIDIDPTPGVEFCNGTTQAVTVNVYPEPVGNNRTVTICSDAPFNYDIQTDNIDAFGNALPAVFTYTVSSSHPIDVPAEANRVLASNLPISHTYTNTLTANATITYTITPFFDDPEACAGDPFTVTVIVRPEPQGIPDTDIVCGSSAIGYDLVANIAAGNNLTAGTTFSWVAADNPDVTGESLVPQTGNTITDVITNNTTGNENVVYTVTPISADGCTGNTFVVTVTVRPTPVGANSAIIRCSDEALAFNLSTNPAAVAAATYTIAVNANGLTQSAGTASTGPGKLAAEIADDEWLNNSLNPVNVIYTITPVSADGCSGVPFTITVQINPEPIGIGAGVVRCSDEAVALTLTSNLAAVAAATYDISVNPNGLTLSAGTNSNGTGKAANELADDVWLNTGLLPVNVVYTITPVSAAGCAGDDVTVTVTINPEPVGAINAADFCSDEALGITLTTSGASVAAATYNIVVNPNGLVQSAGTGSGGTGKLAAELFADAWRNNGLVPVDVEYTITPVSADGCEGNDFTITATINPEPVGSNSAVTICSDASTGVTLSTLGTSVAAATYNISVNANGLTQSGGTNSNGTGKLANEIVNDAWTNTGLVPVNVIYTIVPVSAAPESCEGDAFTVTVTVNPEPVGANSAALRCSDQAVGITLSTNVAAVAATSYNISVNNGGLTLSAGTDSNGNGKAANELADDVWTNTGLVAVDVVYTVNPVSAAGCIGNSFTVTVTINPEPVGTNNVATRCSDEVLAIMLTTNGASVAANTYTIAVNPNGLTQSGGTASAGALKANNEIADDVWRNNGLNPVDVIYTITPVSADGCSGNSFTITVTINPEPVGANTAFSVCSDAAVGVTITTSGFSVAAATYDIVVTDNGLALVGGTASGGTGKLANEIIGDIWRNTGASAVNVIYTITPVSADGCEGNDFTITVTVNPEPVLSALLNDAVCSDDNVGLVLNTNGLSVAASAYNIMGRVVQPGLTAVAQVAVPSNGVGAAYLSNEVYRNTTNGSLTVSYQVVPVGSIGSCLGDQETIAITINPEPVIATTLDNTVCSDAPVGLVLNVAPGSVAATDYNIVNRIVAPGLIVISQMPLANNVASTYLQNDVYRNTTSAALTVQYIVEATGSIASCLGDQRTITITINPEPVISTALDASRCSDATIGLVLATNGVSVGALNYNIVSRTVAPGLNIISQMPLANNVAAAYLQNDIYRNTTTGSLTVEYVVEATGTIGTCLGDQRTITITIDPEPVVSATLSASRCSDNIVNLVLDTQAGSVAASNYNIISRSVAVGLVPVSQVIVPANNVSTTYLQNEIYRNTGSSSLTVQYVVQAVGSINGCLSDTRTITITIDPEPVISTTLDATVCSDAPLTGLVLNTNGTSVLASSYNIVSRTVAPALVPVVQVVIPANTVADNYLQTEQYTNTTNGPLTVQYVVEATGTLGACLGDQRTITITIDPEPVISPSLNTSVCSDNPVGLILNTNGSSVTALNYEIVSRTVGGGLTPVVQVPVFATNVSANYLQGEVYRNTTGASLTVQYVVRAKGTTALNCFGDTRTITITIDPEPVIAATLDDAICSDQPIGLVLNTNGTSIGASSYNIVSRSVNAGLTGVSQQLVPAAAVSDVYLQNEIYRNTTSGSLNVSYLVEARGTVNNCLGDQRTITITIDPEPVIAANLNDNVCSGEIVNLILNTNGVSIGAASYTIVSRTVAGGLNPISQVVVPQVGVGTGYLQNERYENTTSASLTVEYVVEAVGTINGCTGDQRTITITIDPQPVISSTLDASVCSDNAVNLVLNTDGVGVGAINYNVLTRTVAAGLTPVTQAAPIPANAVTSTFLQSEVYRNETMTSRTVAYEIQARGSINACLSDPLVVTITIDPEPVFAAGLNGLPVCSDDVVGLVLATNGTSVGAASYNFINKIVAGGLNPVAQVVIPSNGQAAAYVQNEVYTNTTAGSLTVQYEVVPVGAINGCLGNQLTVTRTIAPKPVVSTLLDADRCSDDIVNLVLATNGSSVGALNYNVVSRTVAPALTVVLEQPAPVAGVATTYFQNDIYRNTQAVPLTVEYEVEAVGTINGCVGDIQVITRTINPEPVMSSTLDIPNICSDLPIGLMLATNGISVAAAEYDILNITVPGGLTPGGSNTTVPSTGEGVAYLSAHTFNNVGAVQIAVEYRVEPISAAGCRGNFIDITVGIDPEPVVSPSLDKTVCSDVVYGTPLNTNGTSIGAATYDISAIVEAGLTGAASTGLAQPNTIIQNDAFNNQTATQLKVTYTVIPNGTNGCIGDARAIEFKVNPEPMMDVPAPDAICSSNANQPDQTEIVLSTNGTSVNAVNYRLLAVQYSDGGPFSAIPPVGFNPNAANRAVNGVSGINLVRTDKFNNVSLNQVQVRYTIEPIGPTVGVLTCTGDADDVTITVNPEPLIDPSISPTAVCSDVPAGASAELSEDASSVAIASYIIKTISFPDLIAGTGNTGIGANKPFNTLVTETYTNVTEVQKTATYTIAPVSAAGCTGLDDQVVLTIDPAPNLADNLSKIVCNDATASITLSVSTTVDANGGYDIMDIDSNGGQNNLTPNGGNAVIGNGLPANILAADRFVNGSTATDTVRYGIKPVSGAGCKGPREVITLVIEPPIQMNAGISHEICSAGSTNFVLTSGTSPSAGNVTFNYSAASTSPQLSGFSLFQNNLPNNHIITDVLTNNANIAHTVTYTVTPRAESAASGAGCFGTPSLFVERVQPKPKLVALPSSFTVCEGEPIGVDLTTASAPTDGAAVPIPVGFNLIRVEEESGAIPDSVSGFETTLPRVYTPGTDVLNETLVNIDTVQRVIRYFFEPSFDIVSGTCLGDETSVIVTVSPRAQIVPLTAEEICSGEEFSQSIEVTGAEAASTLITWKRQDPPPAGVTGSANGAGNTITQVLFNNNNSSSTVTYTFTPTSFNCVGPTATLVATVLPTPKIVGLASSFDVCNEDDFEADLDSFSPTTAATFTWTVDNTDPLVLGPSSGAGTAIDETWENLTGALASVTYTILPIVEKTDGSDCVGPVKIVSVNVAPVVGATLLSSSGDNDDFLCEGSKGFIFFENTGLPSFELTYETNDGSTVTSTTLTKQGSIKLLEVTPPVTTTYTVLSVKDAFGCEIIPTTDNVVTVNVADTDAAFSIVGDIVNCSPFKAEFAYDQQNGVNYNWKWFNGDPDSTYVAGSDVIGQTVKHIFENPAPTATVKYKVFLETSFPDAADPDDSYPGGCFSTSFKEVQVYPTVAPAVFADKTEICSGEEVRFVNTSQGVRSDKFFYRVQGSGGELEPRTGSYTPPAKPATSTLYTLSNLTASNPLVLEVVYQSANLNCPAPDVVIPITVYRGMVADFTTSTPTQFIGGHSFVDVTNTSNPIDATDFTYEWNFGAEANPADLNGTTPPNPIDYTTPGLKEISLVVTNILAGANGLVCTDEIRKTITITVPPLVADFDAIPLAACFPTDITIVENRATGDEFEWEVIDEGGRTSATSNANLPVFAIPNPGKYTVFLTTRNSFTGDATSTSKELEIFELPTASFEVRPSVVFIPDQEITSFNFSSGANQYEWDFGDGNTSFDFEPTFTYKIEGEYPITLIAGFNNGSHDVDGDGVNDGTIICYDTLTRTVQAKDGGVTRIPNSFTPNPNGPNGGNAGSGSFNDVFLPITKGVEEFMMQIFDRWGNLVFESREKDQGWDGYHRNGSLMPAGVYVFKLELRLSNGQRTTQVGDITLIR